MNEEQCKKRWASIRDRYVRLKRTLEKPIPCGSGADTIPKVKWELYHLMDALLHHCRAHRKGGNSFELTSTPETSTTPSPDTSDHLDTPSPSSSNELEAPGTVQQSNNEDYKEICISEEDGMPKVIHPPGKKTMKRKASQKKFILNIICEFFALGIFDVAKI
ncbi:hypothetical protein Pmani_031929 [Petrolisthes manimaculis]|uniref:MADF domain-containing protein n=1 Tax=Petrolisthes manimaculis TaxID=1843537 RepID=A0AAE1NSR4_9EUCA|nr:hypothetical protein Pmani_031929 [Petrolisthes manimaculis]